MEGTLYIIQKADYIGTNIYKFGKTNDILKLLNEYPKDTKLLFSSICHSCEYHEKKILKLLNKNFKNLDDGYFECEITDLLNIVISYINHITIIYKFTKVEFV